MDIGGDGDDVDNEESRRRHRDKRRLRPRSSTGAQHNFVVGPIV